MNSTPATVKTPWGLVILLGSLTAFAPMSIDMYLSSLPAIGADLHATAAQTQGTLAAFFAGMAIGQMVRARMPAESFRRWFQVAMILLGLYLAGSAIAKI